MLTAISRIFGATTRRMSPGFGMLRHRAVEGQRSHGKRHEVRKQNSQDAADGGDHQGFGQELEQDVPLACAQRLLHADLASALRHRDQHDVHQADAADAERDGSDECQQNLQSQRDDAELRQLLLRVEDKDRTLVVRLEVVGERQRSRIVFVTLS